MRMTVGEFRTYFKNKTVKKNKYGAKKTTYKDRTFHSGMEKMDAMWLEQMVKDGKIKNLESQKKISIDINGHHMWNHFVDFEVTLNNGKKIWVETKGFETLPWKRNVKLINALYDQIYLTNPKEKEILRAYE